MNALAAEVEEGRRGAGGLAVLLAQLQVGVDAALLQCLRGLEAGQGQQVLPRRNIVGFQELLGQLPAGTVPEEVIKHVGAPLYYRLLVLAEPLTPEAADLAAAVTAAAAHAGVFVPPDPGQGDRTS